MGRQVVLERVEPPVLWVLLDENVLHREVGGTTVMAEQMGRVAALAGRPRVTVQVIPRVGAHVGLQGAFSMAETPDVLVAHLEHIAEGMMTDSPAIVAEANLRFDSLRADAYRRSESLDLIEEAAKKWNL